MSFDYVRKALSFGIALLTFLGLLVGSIFVAGEWYGNKNTELTNLQKKDIEIEAKLDEKNRERKEDCVLIKKEMNQHMQDNNQRLERIEEMVGKVVEYVWQGEGEKCKILSKRKKMPKKKSVNQRKQNNLRELKVYASDE